jgi:hypothetical protein
MVTNYRGHPPLTATTQRVPLVQRSYISGEVDDVFNRFVTQLIGRIHGPFAFRFALQPIMAGLFAALDGVKDARLGRPAYLWSVLTHGAEGRALLREGLHRVTRVLVLGVVMDVLYQLIEFKTIYPGELVVIVLALAFVPYLLLRGPVNRAARRWMSTNLHTWDAHPTRRHP